VSRSPTRVTDLVDHAFRHFYGRIVARLVRKFGAAELELIEESTQEAFLAALRTWPFRDPPDDPFAWLLRTAHNRSLDNLRRRGRFARLRPRLEQDEVDGKFRHDSHHLDLQATAGEVSDDTLRLIFMCCHPALARLARVMLTLKTVCGFTGAEIANALATNEPTVSQRILRSKRTLREGDYRFEIPRPEEWVERLPPVLDVLFLLFNEGYRSAGGPSSIREDLVDEAIRLVELLALNDVGRRPEVAALRAMFWFQSSRLGARIDADGAMIPLAQQDRKKWDVRRISRGLECLAEAATGEQLSDYHLLAEISAVHATAESVRGTDWARIVRAYDALRSRKPSFIVDLNRAIAISFERGAEIGLEALDELKDHPAAETDSLYAATRAEFLSRCGLRDSSLGEFRRAVQRTKNEAERRYLRVRISQLESER